MAVLAHNITEGACEARDLTDVNAFIQSRSAHVSKHIKKNRPASLLSKSTSALSSILRGSVGKDELELVLAHYNEDITWSNAYAHIRTVYCKGPVDMRPADCIELKNVGREGHTFLHHIVENYDKLSKWTVFSQAEIPTHGYHGQDRGGGHMLPGVPFDAYVLDEDAGGLPRDDGTAFVFTGAIHMGTLNHSLRLSYRHATDAPSLHAQTKCPQTELLDGWQRWWELGQIQDWIAKKCRTKAKQLPAFLAKYWRKYIKLPKPPNDIVFFAQGARFAASKERIRQRPKQDYVELLRVLSKSVNPCHNFLNEWLWYYMIGMPTEAPCSTTLLVYEGSQDSSWTDDQSILQEVEANRLPLA